MLKHALVLALALLSIPLAAADDDPDLVAVPVARAGIGQLVLLPRIVDLDGAAQRFARRVVFVMTSPTCPVSKKYGPAIARLSARERVVLVGVQVDGTRETLKAFADGLGFRGVVVHDPQRTLAAALGATTTTEAFLVDRAGRLVYRGALDDQYGLDYARDAPRRRYLEDALVALTAGRAPAVPTTSAPGCKLGLASTAPRVEATPTWHGSVSRIVARNCQSCHRTGGGAPFPLTRPEQLTGRAPMVRWVIQKRRMPPWFARPGVGHFSNDRSLSEGDKTLLLAWLAEKQPPLGDPALAAPVPVWPKPGSWQVRADHVFQIPAPVKVKAEGRMPYVNVRVKVPWKEERWISAWEIRPTAPDVVHHALVFVAEAGKPLNVGGASGQLAGYAPGGTHATYPAGLGKRIPGGTELHFQIHYTPVGTARVDQLEMAVSFSKTRPRHELVTLGAAQIRLHIPAGAKAHSDSASVTMRDEVVLLALAPHMHYRGKSMRFELVEEKGRRLLLDVPRYDFNWQLAYHLAEPLRLAKGRKIVVTGVFDNSAGNPANPNPDKDVFWGEQSDDEMLLGYLWCYYPNIPAGDPVPARPISPQERWFLTQDKDRDNRLSPAECPPMLRQYFKVWDVDKDGFLTPSELNRMAHMMRAQRQRKK